MMAKKEVRIIAKTFTVNIELVSSFKDIFSSLSC
jgi:hypothetical protein